MKKILLILTLVTVFMSCEKDPEYVFISGTPENTNTYDPVYYKGKEYTFSLTEPRKREGSWYLDEKYLGDGKEIKVVFTSSQDQTLHYREYKGNMKGEAQALASGDYQITISTFNSSYLGNWSKSYALGIHPEYYNCYVTEVSGTDSLLYHIYGSNSSGNYWKFKVLPTSATSFNFVTPVTYRYSSTNNGTMNGTGTISIDNFGDMRVKVQTSEGLFETVFD